MMADCPKNDGRKATVAVVQQEEEEDDPEEEVVSCILQETGEVDSVVLAITKEELIFEVVTVNERKGVRVMVDTGLTGASISVVTPAMAKELNLEVKPFTGPKIRMADGTPRKPGGKAYVEVSTEGGLTAKGEVMGMALPHLPGLLLGNDFLQQFRKMTMDYTEEGSVLTLGALLEMTEDEQYSVTFLKDQAIPARSWISVDADLNLRRGRGEEWKTWVIIPSARLMEKRADHVSEILKSSRKATERSDRWLLGGD